MLPVLKSMTSKTKTAIISQPLVNYKSINDDNQLLPVASRAQGTCPQ